ncbi:hypothetical protein [Spirosoma sp. KNUC1025]|uniref:hypothetical protein n=1 Tax=Spirosoma sp. KNUC1025 TaxID=2894082 RepID=UPI00386EBAD2|nr:hypothetical protein LN737_15865 [Spirosoma sp. KNUC1025]
MVNLYTIKAKESPADRPFTHKKQSALNLAFFLVASQSIFSPHYHAELPYPKFSSPYKA